MRRFAALLACTLIALPAFAAAPLEVTVRTAEGPRTFTLEVAATEAEREHGLMDRELMGEHDGMIFLFPQPGDYHFWMKDTRIPLDMLFLGADRRVARITHAKAMSLNLHGADVPVAAVIELDGGRAAREGIAVGDTVDYAIPEGLQVQ